MPHVSNKIQFNAGPILMAYLGLSSPHVFKLSQLKQTAPDPVPIKALLDTGASCTCVDPWVLRKLKLQPTGKASIHTPSTGNVPQAQNQYDVSLYLTHPDHIKKFEAVPVVEAVLANQGFDALIGRDILSECLLVYDGVAQSFTVAF